MTLSLFDYKAIASPGYFVRGGAQNLKKNNFRVINTQKHYEIHAINSDKAIRLYIFSG